MGIGAGNQRASMGMPTCSLDLPSIVHMPLAGLSILIIFIGGDRYLNVNQGVEKSLDLW